MGLTKLMYIYIYISSQACNVIFGKLCVFLIVYIFLQFLYLQLGSDNGLVNSHYLSITVTSQCTDCYEHVDNSNRCVVAIWKNHCVYM